MKSLTFLIFLFLLVPGSGRLIWDGLPFSTRTEFVSIVLVVVAVFSREIRDSLRRQLANKYWSGLLKPSLVVLCTAKLLSFAWLPMSAGFEACYQSLYNPLQNVTDWRGENLEVCEKSYEGPFLPGGGTGFANTSRVDSEVDFGKQAYDWSLPFMNDYPRLGNLWLSRFPFAATYAAEVTVADDDAVIPIYSIGELTVLVNREKVISLNDYDRHRLTPVQLNRGTSELVFRYVYRDDMTSVPPDVEPTPRGPYASLKIGAPRSEGDLVGRSRVLIVATANSVTDRKLLQSVVIRDSNDEVVAHSSLAESRSGNDNELLKAFDLEIAFPAEALNDSPLMVSAGPESSSVTLGTIVTDPDSRLEIALEQSPEARAIAHVDVSVVAERDSFETLRPDTRANPSITLRALLALLDLASAVLLAIIGLTLLKTAGMLLAQAIGVALLAWLAIEPLDSLLPSFMGGGRELVVPYAALSLLVIAFRRQILRMPLVFLLPLSGVLAAQKVFEHLYFNHPGEGDDWWGKLIFLWRDSDWFANQGNARATFVEGSLRGGESVFWFRAAPRYLITLAHYLFGENDVLIGLISLSIGFMIVWLLAATFIEKRDSLSSAAVGCFTLFICLIFLGDQITTAFAFFVSSEYPTWLIFLGVAVFLLRNAPESRVWVTTSMVAILAVTVHFRPNGVIVPFALLPLLLLKFDRGKGESSRKQLGWGLTAFLVILPLSLLHNLYYGQQFVLFTPSPTNMLKVRFGEILRDEGVIDAAIALWTQLRAVMYWRVPHDPNFAIFFWGSQLLLAAALITRIRQGVFKRTWTLIALVPATYAVPMLPFELKSYYPRLLVSASLLCLCSALLLWPKRETKQLP